MAADRRGTSHPRSMQQPQSIAWVVKGDETYGVRAAVLNLARGVKARGVRPCFVTLSDGLFAAELRECGYAVVVAKTGAPANLAGGFVRRLRTVLFNAVATSRRSSAVAAALRQCRPDALHVLWPNLVSIAAGAAARLSVPCFWEMPNIISDTYPLGLNRRLYRAICSRGCVTVLANSDYTGRTFATGAAAPVTMYAVADSNRFDPAKVNARTRAGLGIPENARVFAIVARIDEQKGQLPFFEGMLAAQTPGEPPLHLLLLGGPTDGKEAVAMRDMARSRGTEDRLHFAGVVSDPEAFYPLIDVAVNARVDPEPFGLSVVEAMLMERPVLVHALGGPAETVLDGRTGWHCHGATPKDWEAAIRRVLADAPNWREMGRAARRHAMEHFSIERVTATYLAVVNRTIAQRVGSRPGADS